MIINIIIGYVDMHCISSVITLYTSPVLSVFDDEEENKLSYTEIHQQYKQLVSNGISPRNAIGISLNTIKNK